MAPITHASDETNHQALLDELDIQPVLKPFRNISFKAAMRRNKNVRQIISEASRKEASVLATQNNSGTSTPIPATSLITTGDITPIVADSSQPNLAQASKNLSTLVAEKSQQTGATSGPAITYTNIESAPSLHPSSQRHYCDITGLQAPYTDPKSRLRYHNGEIFNVIRTLNQAQTESYLAARGAHTVLK